MDDAPNSTIWDVIKLMNDLHERVLHRLTAIESGVRDLMAKAYGRLHDPDADEVQVVDEERIAAG